MKLTKVKQVNNPDFDFLCGYLGGFDDIPTKQDKFKPITNKKLYFKADNGIEYVLEGEFYMLNNKAKENMKKFESKFIESIENVLTKEHPYKKPIKVEVVMNIKMSSKRLDDVDVDNLAKCALDYLKGRVFEDDTQVQSLFVCKAVIEDEFVPQLSGITVGIRILDKKPSLLGGLKFYDFVKISDEEYESINRK
jgi:Holliday junction resolvase RusA-like endonuclease